MKKVLITTLAALYLVYLSGVTGIVLAAGSADLSITRASDLNASGQFTINVNINITSGDSSGARATFTFDDTVLDYVSGTLGTFYDINSDWGAGSKWGPYKIGNSVNFTVAVPVPPVTTPPTPAQWRTVGQGVLATFTFAVTTPPAAGQQISTVFNFDEANCMVSNWDAASARAINILNASPDATINLTGYTQTVTHTITGLTPNNGAMSGAYPVVINGDNLDSLTTKSISWGGTTITSSDPRVTWPTTATGDITLSSIPAVTTAGTVSVNVAGTTGGPFTFTYNAGGTTAHTITSLSPNNGAMSGAYPVTINGTNLDSLTTKSISWGAATITSTDSRVTWPTTATGGIVLSSIPSISAAGTVSVNVTGTTGGPLTFTYNAGTTTPTADPYISYLTPNSGMANADVVVTIVGGNFGSTSGSVTFGQYTATISSWANTEIKVTAPKLGQIASSVSYEVRVTRTDGKYATSYYTYLAPASTGGTGDDTTADTGMPMSVWAGLISANGVLAFFVKRRFL